MCTQSANAFRDGVLGQVLTSYISKPILSSWLASLRLEFPDKLYHATARGNAQQDIYLDDTDREIFLSVLAEVVERFK